MNKISDDIRKKYSSAPHKSGVYIFRDERDVPLYIGKAKDLKKRIASYIFGKLPSPRIVRMIKRARKLEWIITDNELEALILEANLVRKHKPRYNVDLKDDKRYPYIKITNEPFPRLLIVRHRENDGAKYFGPYADHIGAVKLNRTIRRLFRIRVCKREIPSRRKQRACVLYDIGKCLAPCIDACTQEEYSRAVEEVIMFLRGKRRELIASLRDEMKNAAELLEFERAAQIRDTIAALEKLTTPQKMEGADGDRDFVAIAAGGGAGIAVIFRIRQGAMIARNAVPLDIPKKNTIPEILSEFLPRFYARDGDVPEEIFVSEMPLEADEIAETLKKIRKKSTSIKIPHRGKRRQILELAQHNAELIHSEMMLQKQKVHIPYGVLELERLLDLPKTPNTIEAFDISNIGSETIVASMVQFVGGKANRKGYRHFRIKSSMRQDDFAAMREVIFRRYRRLLDEGKPLPDLILIDGGKGQLSSALDSLKTLSIAEKVSTIALAKRLDEVFVPDRTDSIMLPKNSAALKLLQRIRDEAHRFAITFSRKSHRKKAMQLELTQISGIGEKRALKLLKEFGSLENIADAEAEEIAEKIKIPKKLAEKIKDELKE